MKSECCHGHPDNGDLATQTPEQAEETDLRATNEKLLAALEAAGELWGYLPFDSGADVQEVAQRVATLQRAAIQEARK
ncbi:MAG: hypothetical protein V3U27_21425 [Candidatus Tectomicrobia bacterium]